MIALQQKMDAATRPTPETDAKLWITESIGLSVQVVNAQVSRRLERQRDEVAAALEQATNMRPALLMTLGYVPEPVLEYCNLARAALAKIKAGA